MATKLKENASLLDVVMLGAGAAVGSSIFSVLGPAARVAGPMLLAAIAVAVIPMAILAFVYAFVASAAPRSGASYEWPREFIGPRFAFGVAWLRILGSIGFLVTGSLVLTHYLVLLTAFPSTLTMFAILTATYLLNVLGVSFAAKAQSIMMSVLIVTFTIFVVASFPHTRAANVTPLLHLTNVDALLLTLPLLIHLFMGIETATEIGEEVRDAARMIPRGIALSVLLTLAIYLIITITALGVVGLSGMSQGDTPLAGAAKVAGPAAQAVIMVAAILCLIKSLNVNFLIF
jgi:APA family basic amino acid/polyamine antiporter